MDIIQGRHRILYDTYHANESFVHRIINMHKKKVKKAKQKKLRERERGGSEEYYSPVHK